MWWCDESIVFSNHELEMKIDISIWLLLMWK